MRARSVAFPVLRIAAATTLALVLLVALLVWSVSDWYPLNALAWHVRHGNFASVGEFRVPVSFWVLPDDHYGPNALHMDLRAKKFGHVSFEVGRPRVSARKWLVGLEANAKSPDQRVASLAESFLKLQRTRINIAGQPTVCFGGTTDLPAPDIRCMAEDQDGGLTVDFFGDPKLVPLFYEVLGKVARADSH